MVGTWKVLNKASPGSGSEFGADDTDKINKLLRGDLNVDTVEINSPFRFRDDKLLFRDPVNLFHYILRTSGITNNRNVTLPLLTVDDVFVFNDHAATLTQKSLAAASIPNYIDVSSTSTPANPTTGVLRVYRRTSDNLLVYRNNSGVETAMSGDGAGGGEANTASNLGTAGIGLFKTKQGVDLQFKRLATASGGLITITDDTANNEVDLKISAASIEGQYMRTVGGAVTWDKPGRVMPDDSYYTGPRWGSFIGGATDGDGWFSGLYTQGTLNGLSGSQLARTRWVTSATIGELAGWGTYIQGCRRSQTPRFKWRGSINPSTERGWIGFIDQNGDTYAGGGMPIDGKSGFICGYGASNTTFNFAWNNGSVTSQQAATGITKDNGLHTIELLLNDTSGSISGWFDGTLVVNANTTQVPASTTPLSINARCQAATATVTEIQTEYAMLTFP